MSRKTAQETTQNIVKSAQKKTKKKPNQEQPHHDVKSDDVDDSTLPGENKNQGIYQPLQRQELGSGGDLENGARKKSDKKRAKKKKSVIKGGTTGDASVDKLLRDVNDLLQEDDSNDNNNLQDTDRFHYISTSVYSHNESESEGKPHVRAVLPTSPGADGRKLRRSPKKKKQNNARQTAHSVVMEVTDWADDEPDEIVRDGECLPQQVLENQVVHPLKTYTCQDSGNADQFVTSTSTKVAEKMNNTKTTTTDYNNNNSGIYALDEIQTQSVKSSAKKKIRQNEIVGGKSDSLVTEEDGISRCEELKVHAPILTIKKNKKAKISETHEQGVGPSMTNLAEQVLARQRTDPFESNNHPPSQGYVERKSGAKDHIPSADNDDFLKSCEIEMSKYLKRKSNKKNDKSGMLSPAESVQSSFLRSLEVENEARKANVKLTTKCREPAKTTVAIRKKLDDEVSQDDDDIRDFHPDDSMWVDVVPKRKKIKRKKLTTEMKDKVMQRVKTKKKRKKKKPFASPLGIQETEIGDVLSMKDFEVEEIALVGWFDFESIRTEKGLDRDDQEMDQQNDKKAKSEKRFKSRANYLYQDYNWWSTLEESSTFPAYFMATIGFKKRGFNVSNLFTGRPLIPNPYKFDPKVLQKVHDADDPWDLIKWLMLKYDLMGDEDNDNDDIGMEILGIWHGANEIDGDDDDNISIPSSIESVHFSDGEDAETEEFFNGKRREEVEVTPGNFAIIRGEAETYDALDKGEIIESLCLGCGIALVCVRDALQVSCPMCRSVTPLNGISLHRPFGIATGITRASCRDQLPNDEGRASGYATRNSGANSGTPKVATAASRGTQRSSVTSTPDVERTEPCHQTLAGNAMPSPWHMSDKVEPALLGPTSLNPGGTRTDVAVVNQNRNERKGSSKNITHNDGATSNPSPDTAPTRKSRTSKGFLFKAAKAAIQAAKF